MNKLISKSSLNRLRVCHLGKFYPPAPGGIESHLRTLAQAQSALGAEVHVICVNHRNTLGHDVTWKMLANTPTTEEWDGQVKITRVGRKASFARFEVCLELLPQLLKQKQVDILHLHIPNPTMLMALAAIPVQIPLVITYHSDVIKQKILGKLIRPFEHQVFRKAAAILASSPKYPEGSELLRNYHKKVQVIPFGIDLAPYLNPNSRVRKLAQQLKEQHGQPLWLCVGRFVYYKAFHIAIQALVDVPGKLLMVGGGPLEQDLRKLAEELKVSDRIIWQGRISEEELIATYHAATAFWFPSNARSEAFGLVQVEAMACGCPVINTNIWGSGVPWVSRDNESGLTVPANDPDAFSEAANRLVKDSLLFQRLSENARARALQEFDSRMMAGRTMDTYHRARRVKIRAPKKILVEYS